MSRDILVAGETLVDFIPDRPGALAEVGDFSRRAGGAPANVAVGLARLDRTPWFWTRVGTDPFGDFLARTLAEYGLPDRFLERDPEAKTTLAFVAHDPDADRSFSFYRDRTADTRLEPGGVPDGVLESVEWVYAGGVALASDPARTATLDLIERADCPVVFDPNARPELWDEFDFGATVREVLPSVAVVKASSEDLRAAGIEGEDAPALARAVTERGPHTAFVTRGSAGTYALATDDAPWGPVETEHGGYDADPVDTTGAGDAFTAGALAALADGEPLAEVVEFGNAVAAATVTERGAMAALPDRPRVTEIRSGGGR